MEPKYAILSAPSNASAAGKQTRVGVIMGSDSDFPVMEDAVKVLKQFGIACEVEIVSAHRTPDKLYSYSKTAIERGLKVIIAGAGGSAHLPGMVASLTTLPVIGVPVRTKSLDGLDSYLSIVQMPQGVPVGTVPINGGVQAGMMAARIIGMEDQEIEASLLAYEKTLFQDGEVKTWISEVYPNTDEVVN